MCVSTIWRRRRRGVELLFSLGKIRYRRQQLVETLFWCVDPQERASFTFTSDHTVFWEKKNQNDLCVVDSKGVAMRGEPLPSVFVVFNFWSSRRPAGAASPKEETRRWRLTPPGLLLLQVCLCACPTKTSKNVKLNFTLSYLSRSLSSSSPTTIPEVSYNQTY